MCETTDEIGELKKPLFRDINADDDEPELTEIESLCMQCEEMGTTRLLLTKIPFFKEIIIMSFTCPHCNYTENEIKPSSVIQEKGIKLTLTIQEPEMMNQQIVKQESAMFRIDELDFEAPPFTSKGALTTVEGLFETAVVGLQQQQPVRKALDPVLATKIDLVIEKLEEYKTGQKRFTLILEDISGNSFIENPYAPNVDPCLKTEYFTRNKHQNEQLGLSEPNEVTESKEKIPEAEENIKDEVLEFATNCSSCQSAVKTKMKIVAIPHFKEVIIMAFNCDVCGEKSNEVKGGGAVEPFGKIITFKMTDKFDLTRDVLTSETCAVSIPDIELELQYSSEGGRFTTLEGLMVNMKEQLGRVNPFAFGDSADEKNKLKDVVSKLDQMIQGDLFVTVILDDPVGNSYLQNIYAPDPDPELTVEKYERTAEQNEELGIADIKTEGYS